MHEASRHSMMVKRSSSSESCCSDFPSKLKTYWKSYNFPIILSLTLLHKMADAGKKKINFLTTLAKVTINKGYDENFGNENLIQCVIISNVLECLHWHNNKLLSISSFTDTIKLEATCFVLHR